MAERTTHVRRAAADVRPAATNHDTRFEGETMTTTMNGNVRKSLAEQIDRLDVILDGLAESLSGAVADAVRETVGLSVKEAVQAVLIEVLGNPAVLAKLRG